MFHYPFLCANKCKTQTFHRTFIVNPTVCLGHVCQNEGLISKSGSVGP